jgi:hypothetical protein
MAAGEYSHTILLHDAAAAAPGNGAVVSIGGLTSLLVQIAGTYTTSQVNFQASADGGVNWFAVALLPVGSTTPGTLVATPAAADTGLYRLQDARGFTHFRSPITGTGTGTVTVTAYGVGWQVQS